MKTIQISATDGTGSFDAFVAEPAGTPAGAVVLIQEIFGVNQSMKETAAQIAELGFIVVVPDLFWRIERNVDLTDKSQAEWDQAFALMKAFDQMRGIDDLKATLAAARRLPGCNGRAGTMGYCLGGRLAFMMAEHSDADVNISYYGVGLDGLLPDLPKITRPLIVHIADNDAFFPAEGRQQVTQAAAKHASVKAYTYPNADHAFARVGGTHWHARSAWIANGRSAEALAAALG